MGNLLYIVAIVLLIAWALGFFVYSLGAVIHILLILAIISILVRIIQTGKIIK
ncbi:MAG TPA: lmo0937 family membrane protein [Chitinophagales bacterium]|nr:lmo0937 family membrane protein [Chitinophagales bacterium]